MVTQYEIILLDQAMRVNKVEGFEKDLAMKLGTEGIRIVAPLPNKTTIGVEVHTQCAIKEQVVMRNLVEKEEFDPTSMAAARPHACCRARLPLVLGRDVIGNALIGDLAKMPHLLVAGATGMGKSVCMNSMICSIIMFRGPEHVKFIMIDPKMVELAGYEDIPHLLTPPITDMTKAHAALEWACSLMDERYEALRQVGVRDIKSWNELGKAQIEERLARKSLKLEDFDEAQINQGHMCYVVLLVDEYADLMMVNKEVEKSIVRIAAKSRACGIHVILTTQRPLASADVVTGLIKSNLPARICFRVVDKSNSRVVLDVSGAENLLGRGDMLFLQPGTSQPIRGQGVWLKDSEISAVVEHAKKQGSPVYDDEVVNVGAVAMGEGGPGSGASEGGEWLKDRQFHDAVQAMYRYNRSGADFFRRKCNVGYNKATAYVEQLEDLGFLGPQKGTASREILKSWDDWIELLKAQGLQWSRGRRSSSTTPRGPEDGPLRRRLFPLPTSSEGHAMTLRLALLLIGSACLPGIAPAEDVPDPSAVRAKIDRLEAARIAAGQPASMGLLGDVIDLSISYGAPAYDGGDPAACLSFYTDSATKLVHDFSNLKGTSHEVASALKALADADVRQRASQDVSHRAWSMRFAFDQIKLMSAMDDALAKAEIESGEQYFTGLANYDESEVAFSTAYSLVLTDNLGDQLSAEGAEARVAGILEAQALLELGRTGEAAAVMARAVPMFPEITTSKLDWHQLSRNRAVADQALATSQAAAAAHPDDADLAFLLAVEQRFGGHAEDASKTLALVMKLSPQHAGGRLLLDLGAGAGAGKSPPPPPAPQPPAKPKPGAGGMAGTDDVPF